MTIQPGQEHPPKEKKRGIYLSLGVQLLIAFTLLFGIVFGGIFYWFYNFSSDAAMDRLAEDLETLLVGVSAKIDGDEFRAMVNRGGTSSEDGFYPEEDNQAYWDHVQFLNSMSEIDPRASFYTYTRGERENEVVFVGSIGAVADPPWGVKFLQSYVYPPEDAEVILNGVNETTLYLTIYEDEFGSWISGYSPIMDSTGQTVGALGIDFRADYVRRVQDDVKASIVPAFGITSILLIGMVFVVSSFLTRPIVELTRIAGHIGEGDYEQDLSRLTDTRLKDEIDKLAQVFEIMVGKVAKREQKLKQQVAELQIMIDDTKRQEQVNEIVDSDFFRDLQNKAVKMRQDFAKAGRNPSASPSTTGENAEPETRPDSE